MPRKKLSEEMLRKMSPPAEGEPRLELWDPVLPGFGVRVTTSGIKTFFVSYRADGVKRRLTLGRYHEEAYNLAAARAAARAALDLVTAGKDPIAEAAAAEAEAEAQKRAEAVAEKRELAKLVATYIEMRVKPNRRDWNEVERALRVDLIAKLGNRDIRSISRRDVLDMRDAIIARGHRVHARRVLTMTKAFFAWCVEYDHITADPAAGIRQEGKEVARERVLSMPELIAVWQAADVMKWPFGPLYQLLALTAQRRDEVAGMRWSEIDLDGAVWTLPGARTKNGKEHVVALSPAAVAILRSLPNRGDDLLFSSTGETAPSGWSRAKRRLDGLIAEQAEPNAKPLPPFVIHDLRRSTATHMAELGVRPEVVDAILNHVSGTVRGVARTYNRSEHHAARRAALDLWGETVMAAWAGYCDQLPASRGES
jgi:integrase